MGTLQSSERIRADVIIISNLKDAQEQWCMDIILEMLKPKKKFN